MTTSPSSFRYSAGALFGIAARFRGHVQTPAALRYAVDGSELFEFKVKLAEDWPPQGPLAEEMITVRFGGQHRELERWLAFGRHIMCEGTLHLARWTGKQDGIVRAQLLLEATTVEPLDDKQSNPSRAAAYAPPPPQPTNREPPTQEERFARLEEMVSAAEDPTSTKSRMDPEQRKRLSQRYDQIFGKSGD